MCDQIMTTEQTDPVYRHQEYESIKTDLFNNIL